MPHSVEMDFSPLMPKHKAACSSGDILPIFNPIFVLYCIADLPAGAELVEGTLGHPREDVDHRVQPVLLVPLSERNHL
jgi:hypothetical protein